MITNDNNNRAIEALKRGNTEHFHGDLQEYLIECLECLNAPLDSSAAPLVKAELRFIISLVPEENRIEEMEACIDDWLNIDKIEPEEEEQEEEYEGKLKYWHLNVSSLAIFCLLLLFLFNQ